MTRCVSLFSEDLTKFAWVKKALASPKVPSTWIARETSLAHGNGPFEEAGSLNPL